MDIAHKFVTELTEATKILGSDYVLLSQRDENDSEYMSRKLTYSKLCSAVAADFAGVVSSQVSGAISALELSVRSGFQAVDEISCTVSQAISAVVKVANCVQKNKSDISALSSTTSEIPKLGCMQISAGNGLSSVRTDRQYKWAIGHAKTVSALLSCELRNVAYDEYGHVTSSVAATSSDLVGLGSFVTGAGRGLSSDGHTVSLVNATSAEIGGVKAGDNLAVSEDGTLSAKDTTYSAGPGLSLSGGRFTLVNATSSQAGGVKVGANLSVSEDGVLCAAYVGPATALSAGVIRLNFKEDPDTAKNQYAVRTSPLGDAYVYVPLSNTAYDFQSGTLTAGRYSVITAISYSGGNVTGISTSNELCGLIADVKTSVSGVSGLSDCITTKNGMLTYAGETGTLNLVGGISGETLSLGGVEIPAVVSGGITSVKWEKDGEGRETSAEGLFIELATNTAETRCDNVYVDVSQLSGPQFRRETWVFTLDDGTVVSNDVMLGN